MQAIETHLEPSTMTLTEKTIATAAAVIPALCFAALYLCAVKWGVL